MGQGRAKWRESARWRRRKSSELLAFATRCKMEAKNPGLNDEHRVTFLAAIPCHQYCSLSFMALLNNTSITKHDSPPALSGAQVEDLKLLIWPCNTSRWMTSLRTRHLFHERNRSTSASGINVQRLPSI